jgi:hypothetical protein
MEGGCRLSGIRVLAVAFAIAGAVICALMAGIWRLVRTKDGDQAVATAGYVFVGAITVAFMAMSFLQPD